VRNRQEESGVRYTIKQRLEEVTGSRMALAEELWTNVPNMHDCITILFPKPSITAGSTRQSAKPVPRA